MRWCTVTYFELSYAGAIDFQKSGAIDFDGITNFPRNKVCRAGGLKPLGLSGLVGWMLGVMERIIRYISVGTCL